MDKKSGRVTHEDNFDQAGYTTMYAGKYLNQVTWDISPIMDNYQKQF